MSLRIKGWTGLAQAAAFIGCFFAISIGSADDRIEQLLAQLTLEEKIKILHGDPSEFENHGVPRLSIPSIKMVDGPIGVRLGVATAFPAGVLVGASFDPNLMNDVATAMAREARAKGRDMLLGPTVNIHRAPQGGRNFESFGEDPFLASRFAEAWVQSVQAQGLIASTKHFAANDQEFERMTIDVRVDERTLHEIHFPAFKAAVKAGTLSVMSSYNRLNGLYASENPYLLNSVLKQEWGFEGFVISDWKANHSTVASANAGLDVEMPSGEFWGNGRLAQAVESGAVSMETVNDKVRRVLRALLRSGTMDRSPLDRPDESEVNSPAHQALARRAAAEGLVLLKNNDVLPLQGRSQRIAVIGPNAATARNNGGGSSRVVGPYDVSPLQGLSAQAARRSNVQVDFAAGIRPHKDFELFGNEWLRPDWKAQHLRGLRAEYFDNINLDGNPKLVRLDSNLSFNWGGGSPDPLIPNDNFSARWTGVLTSPFSGDYELRVRSDDGIRVYLNGKLVIDQWVNQPPTTHKAPLRLRAGQDYALKIEYFERGGGAEVHFGHNPETGQEDRDLAEAVQLAAQSDVALVFVGWNEALEHEGRDRSSLSLPEFQDRLVHAVAAANPRTVVIINGGGSVLMPWLAEVAGVVQAWYPGQEGGNALAEVLFGVRNFSGKLPVSMYAREEDASSFGNYPGQNGRVEYREGLYVGYRHLDSRNIEPLFPFGFGLSYTQFEIGNLNIIHESNASSAPRFRVQVNVKNIGSVRGSEVVQVYVHPKQPSVDRPEQELKGFTKVWLNPGETQTVELTLDHGSFAHYDVARRKWVADSGAYEIRVGNSSRNLPLKQTLRLK